VAEEPEGERLAEARLVHEAAVASAAIFGDFADFHWWTLKVERVRWVGADRYELLTARGRTGARVGFEAPTQEADGLRGANVELVRRARERAAPPS
jgi:hypothetical protein